MESSAYCKHRLSDALYSMSVPYKLNIRGPNTGPCETPKLTYLFVPYSTYLRQYKNRFKKFKVRTFLISTRLPEVSNALEKTAQIAIVTSSVNNAVTMSSLNLTSNVKVEYFPLNPVCISLYNSWFAINSTIRFRTNFSYIFDSTGNRYQSVVRKLFLQANLRYWIYPDNFQRLKMFHAGYFLTIVSCDAIYDAMGLNNSIGMLQLLLQALRIILFVSLVLILWILKLFSSLETMFLRFLGD